MGDEIREECQGCGKELVFSSEEEYGKQLEKSGPELECDSCIAKGGGPESV